MLAKKAFIFEKIYLLHWEQISCSVPKNTPYMFCLGETLNHEFHLVRPMDDTIYKTYQIVDRVGTVTWTEGTDGGKLW